MKFREYVTERKIALLKAGKNATQRKIAKEIGIGSSMLSQLLTGTVRPSVGTAAKIEKLSGGKVTARDWS
jgi:transcriptional regulator with XRE-family HTH domain